MLKSCYKVGVPMKEESKKKDIWFVLLFIVVVGVCLLYLFQSSYAKYRRAVSGSVNGDIASWQIKVNGEDIMNKKTLNTTITPFFPEDETHAEDVIAPGVEGYYTISIDASNVDVPFRVTIFSEVAENSSVSDLKTYTYEYNSKLTPPTSYSSRNYYNNEKGIVYDIARNSKTNDFRIYVIWDEKYGTMDNAQDTEVGIDDNSKALMNVRLHFEQIK